MKKVSLFLIVATLLCVAFTAGLFLGRAYGSEPLQILNAPDSNTNTGTAAATATIASGGQAVIDLNTATSAQLQTLPGIGSVLAQRILDYREANGPFETISQLANVEGIGEKRLEAIAEYICIGGQHENTGS